MKKIWNAFLIIPFFIGLKFLVIIFLIYPVSMNAQSEKVKNESIKIDHQDPEGFYTCPMHPQVHEHKPGNCPICGMPLVKKTVVQEEDQNQKKEVSIKGPEISVTSDQLKMIGVSQYTVTKKNLEFSLPVSGRLISSQELAFQVFESDLAVLKIGMDFSGTLATSPEETVRGKIRSIDNLVDPSSRTIRVVGSINHSIKRFVQEGAFHGEIQIKLYNQITIPEESVVHTGLGSLVYLFTGNSKLSPASVIIGQRSSKEYQVLSGLKEGDVISSGPNFLIDSESKIRGGP